MTRFDKFCHFGKFLIYLAKNFESLFSIWQNVKPHLANFLCYCANFHSSKFQHSFGKVLNRPSGHTDAEAIPLVYLCFFILALYVYLITHKTQVLW